MSEVGEPPLRRRLGAFRGDGYTRGRALPAQIAWLLAWSVASHWWCPQFVRVGVLRVFGASVGHGVVVRHGVRVHWPWRLTIGDNCWIGEGAWILNLDEIRIGDDVCISQDVLLCTGSHDLRSPSFEFDNGPIVIEDGVWIAARATILRGVTVGADSVIGATALITKDVPPGSLVRAPAAQP